MRKDHLRVSVCTTLILFSLFLSGPASVFGSWGLEVGRANASDVANLAREWVKFRKIRADVDSAATFAGTDARQRQLLGVDTKGWTPQQLYPEVEKFWLDNLIGPLQTIARNPAASCAEAQFALSTLIGMQRLVQLLGLEESKRVSAEFEATEKIVNVRCREEALDECVATGRIKRILDLVAGDDRQSRLRGREPDDGIWAEEALTQCAIYELRFVSTTKDYQQSVLGPLQIETVRDGKIPIRFQVPKGELKSIILSQGEILKGRNEGGNNPFFVSVKCQFPSKLGDATCSPGADSTPIEVRIKALEIRHREFYFNDKKEYEVAESEAALERMVGEDKLMFEFEGGDYTLQALIKIDGNILPMPLESSGVAFYQAHTKDEVGGESSQILKIEGAGRGVYPTVFQFTYTGQNRGVAVATDSTEFKLIHKPEPKPFEKPAEPIRKPLKPRPGE